MAIGFSPKLPLSFNDSANYELNQTLPQLVNQNLKNLILTAPGERIMDPEFGVGLRNYLFESNISSTYSNISARINNQVKRYMNFLNILDIKFMGDDENENKVYVSIQYIILPLSTEDELSILVTI